jgi:hypothetical protein
MAALAPTIPGDVQWDVTATFAGGGTLSGYFYIDAYGYLSGPFSLVTTPGGSFTGAAYDNTTSDPEPGGPDDVDLSLMYVQDLNLKFADSLTSVRSMNPLVIVDPANTMQFDSYECNILYCGSDPTSPVPSDYRVFASGYATGTIPEPMTWSLMCAGVTLGGASLRVRRGRRVAAA